MTKLRPVWMIVEDEVVIGIDLEDRFRDAGFDVQGPFATCSSALAQLAAEAPHVDTVLKDGTCLELARELRERGIPFVIYSGRIEKHEYAPELVGHPWVAKPAMHGDVVRAASQLLTVSAGK